MSKSECSSCVSPSSPQPLTTARAEPPKTIYSRFEGLTVVRALKDVTDMGTYYGLSFSDGSAVWFDRDPEGNGPGHGAIHMPPPPKPTCASSGTATPANN